MKYKLKSPIIEAEQWFPEKEIEGVVMRDEISASLIAPNKQGVFELCGWIPLQDALMIVRAGDYVITLEDGTKSSCSKDFFEGHYEEVID